jgi:hypothetical protein
VEPIREYRFSTILGPGDREKVRDYYSTGTHLATKPYPGVPEALEMAASEAQVYLVSGRQWYARSHTEDWLVEYGLDRWVTDLVLCNSYSLDGPELEKCRVVKALGASMCIDDSTEVIKGCLQMSVPGMVCTQRGFNTWSEGSDLPECSDLLEGVSKWRNPPEIWQKRWMLAP